MHIVWEPWFFFYANPSNSWLIITAVVRVIPICVNFNFSITLPKLKDCFLTLHWQFGDFLCRHECLCLPVDFLSERSQLALGPIGVQAGQKGYGVASWVSSIWATLETCCCIISMEMTQSSRQLLDTFFHSSNSSWPIGIGTEGGGRVG